MIGMDVSYTRISAIVELQGAQGWKSISETPRFRAEVNYVEIKALDVYTLIVDKIDLTDSIITADSAIFDTTKILTDTANAVESIAFDVSKPFNDSAIAGENITFKLDKSLSDNVTQSDSTIFNMNKLIQDGAPPADSVIFNMKSDGNGGLNDYAINEAAINANVINIRVF